MSGRTRVWRQGDHALIVIPLAKQLDRVLDHFCRVVVLTGRHQFIDQAFIA